MFVHLFVLLSERCDDLSDDEDDDDADDDDELDSPHSSTSSSRTAQPSVSPEATKPSPDSTSRHGKSIGENQNAGKQIFMWFMKMVASSDFPACLSISHGQEDIDVAFIPL